MINPTTIDITAFIDTEKSHYVSAYSQLCVLLTTTPYAMVLHSRNRHAPTGHHHDIHGHPHCHLSDQEVAVWYNDHVIYPDKVRINCYYYRHYSFIKDIQMIFCTVLGKNMKYAGEVI